MNEYDIARMYQEMELELISSLRRNLKGHLKKEIEEGFNYPQWQALKLKELERVKAENLEIIEKHTSAIPRDIKRIINREYRQGKISAVKLHEKYTGKGASKLNESFLKINNRKVEILIDEINGTVSDSKYAIFRMLNDKYRSTIYKAEFFLAHGAKTIDQATDMALKDFIRSGINCIEYSDGRRINIADYTRMAVRTASQRAMLHAEGDFRKERGYSLVKVTFHHTACKLCKPWENKVLIDDVYSKGQPDGKHELLSTAMSKGLFHPNCKHGLPTYYPELEEIYEDIAKGKTLQEEEEVLKDSISQYEQRTRRQDIWRNNVVNIKDLTDKKAEENRISLGLLKAVGENKINAKSINNKNLKLKEPLVDVTDIWLNTKHGERGTVSEQTFFKGKDGQIHIVDGKNAVLDHRKSEREIADFFAKLKELDIKLMPRILKDKGIKTPDFIESTTGIPWEIKEPKGDTSVTTMSNQFKHQRQKSKKFIIDIKNSKMTEDFAIDEIEKIINNPRYYWIEEIVLIKNKKILRVYQKK